MSLTFKYGPLSLRDNDAEDCLRVALCSMGLSDSKLTTGTPDSETEARVRVHMSSAKLLSLAGPVTRPRAMEVVCPNCEAIVPAHVHEQAVLEDVTKPAVLKRFLACERCGGECWDVGDMSRLTLAVRMLKERQEHAETRDRLQRYNREYEQAREGWQCEVEHLNSKYSLAVDKLQESVKIAKCFEVTMKEQQAEIERLRIKAGEVPGHQVDVGARVERSID